MFDKVLQRFKAISKEENWIVKVLIGGLLLAIPVLNAVSFGYLVDLLEDVKEKREVKLAQWQNIEKLFLLGLPLAVLCIAWLIVIMVISKLLSILGCFGMPISFILNLFLSFVLPLVWVIVAYRLIELRNWKEAVNVGIILDGVQKNFKESVPYLALLVAGGFLSFFAGCCFFAGIPYFYVLLTVLPFLGEIVVRNQIQQPGVVVPPTPEK